MRLANKALGVTLVALWALAGCAGNDSADSPTPSSSTVIKSSILDAPAPVGSSVNGTTIPSAAQIIDSGGNVWTVSGGVFENGTSVTAAPVTLLMYDNDSVYEEDTAGNWWLWNGTAWVSTSNPTLLVSPAGTSIPKANQITDSSGNVWAESGGVYKNGIVMDASVVTRLLYDNNVIFLEDTAGNWWSWNGSDWASTTDPTVVPSPPGAKIPTVPQITDGNGNIWAVIGGTVYENGALAGNSNQVTLLIYFNNTIFRGDATGLWWSWNGSAWASNINPTVAASPPGTTIPTAPQITDNNGNLWSVVNGVVYQNGASAGYSNAVQQLTFQNGTIFQLNSLGTWWSWHSGWYLSGDPTGGSVGSATLSWTAPTQNSDGTPLTNLAGYTISYGTSASALTQTIQLADPTATNYVVPSLGAATYYFAVAAYSSLGFESANSTVVSKTIASD